MVNRRDRYRTSQFEDDFARRDSQPEQFQSGDYSQPGEGGARYDHGSARYARRTEEDRVRAYRSADDYDPLGDYDRGFSRGTPYREPTRTHSYFRPDDYGGEDYSYGRYDSFGAERRGFADQHSGAYSDRGRYQEDRDRGFLERAGDEVASWFGDDEAARRREMDHRGRGPANYTRSNERLLEDACERLTSDRFIDARKISVTAEDNEITLDGTVTSRAAKRRAEDCVHDIHGVRHVQNNLRITDDEHT